MTTATTGRVSMSTVLVTLAATIGVAGCWSERTSGLPIDVSLRAVEVANGLANPLHLTAPAGDARLFVVEQPGRIRIVQGGRLLERAFLDITSKVASGGERGLLGLAFHPSYATNGFFYVYYTNRNGD